MKTTRTLPRRSALILGITLLAQPLIAQHQRPTLPPPSANKPFATGDAERSAVQTALRSGVVNNRTVTTNWATKVARVTARNHGLPEVNAIKDAKLAAKWASAVHGKPQAEGGMKSVVPTIGSNFEGNW
ncbi:MAG: hypothetical protein JNM91_12050, partial [Flavobacteriales bacterium]|nr:hypothetical protein [Flavobacteriales bacterium]